MEIITIATDPAVRYYPALNQSCINKNIPLITLGVGEEWTGFAMKLNLYKKYIESQTTEKILVCVDGYDMICLADKSEIIKRFKTFKCGIVFTADMFYQKTRVLQYWLRKMFVGSKQYDYKYGVQTGGFIGYTSALKKLFGSFDYFTKNEDDQRFINEHLNKTDIEYKLDTDQILFKCLEPASSFFMLNSTTPKVTDSSSTCFVHGCLRVDMNLICKQYNLPLALFTVPYWRVFLKIMKSYSYVWKYVGDDFVWYIIKYTDFRTILGGNKTILGNPIRD